MAERISLWSVLMLLCLSASHSHAQSDAQVIHVSYVLMEEETDQFIGSLIAKAQLDQLFPEDLTRLKFAFLPQSPTYIEYFVIGETTGQLWTSGTLDRDDTTLCPQKADVCHFTLDVGIMEPVENFRIIKVNITLEDINDNGPTFTDERFSLSISELTLPVVSFVIPTATDKDSQPLSINRYELTTETSKFELQVNQDGAALEPRLLLMGNLDREVESKYMLHLVAYDGGRPSRSGTMTIEVQVRDANDNKPVFEQELYSTAVGEDFPLNETLVQVWATDPDLGPNGNIVYKFATQTENLYSDTFHVNNETGAITLKSELDYEEQSVYQLVVMAEDQGPDSLPTHCKVTIHVEDVNDHFPKVTVGATVGNDPDSTEITVPENMQPRHTVAHISVSDKDQGPSGQVSCSLHSPYFALEPVYQNSLYRVVSSVVFDREERAQFTITLQCEDAGEPPLRSSEEITVIITDDNDNSPVFTQSVYTAVIKENDTIGRAFLTVNATDADSGVNGEVHYQMHSDALNLVTIDSETGVLKTNAVFDHEKTSAFEFHVVAVDGTDLLHSALALVKLTIEDVNDEAPVFTELAYKFGTFENQGQHVEIGGVNATDSDSAPYDRFVYSLGHRGLSGAIFRIDEQTGRISTLMSLDREHREVYHLLVIATNVQPPHLQSTVNVTVEVADVNDNAPMITYPSVHNQTLEISADTPKGYIFTKVEATDADVGDNAELIYLIAKGDEDNVFDIDPLNGGLSANRDLGDLQRNEFELLLMVKDQGGPQKAAVATLYLTVNASLDFVWLGKEASSDIKPDSSDSRGNSDDDALGFHEQVIIILGCVTAVLVTILVAAILWVRRKQRQRLKETYKYMCRVDMTRRMPVTGQASPDEHNDSDASDVQLRSAGEPRGMAVAEPPLIQPAQKTHITLQDLKHVQWSRPKSTQSVQSAHSGTSSTGHHHHLHHRPLSGRHHMEVQQLLQLLKRDTDAESSSASSAEISNADSGHGASEEGGDHAGHPPHRLAHRRPDGQEREGVGHSEKVSQAVPPPCPPRTSSHRTAASGYPTRKPPLAPPSGGVDRQQHLQTIAPNYDFDGGHGQHQGYGQARLCPPKTSKCAPGHFLSTFSQQQQQPVAVSNTVLVSDNEDNVSDDDGGSSTSGSFIVELEGNGDIRAVDV